MLVFKDNCKTPSGKVVKYFIVKKKIFEIQWKLRKIEKM